MIAYHFTSISHLPDIMRTGRLGLTESNISRKRRMAGPPVVWLTKNGEPATGSHGLPQDPALEKLKDFYLIDKTRIRIKVEVPTAFTTKYEQWAKGQGIDKSWLRLIMKTKGANSWWVCTRPITMASWLEVRDVSLDKVLWLAGPRSERVSAKAHV